MRNIVKLEESGVSEVVGTILILVITVILFATVFTYVQHIPPPSKSAQLVIQSSIYGTGKNISIQLKDLAGSTLNSNETYLDIYVNGTFKSFNFYDLTKKPTFGPGSYLNINLFDLGIQVINISSLGLLIFSEQYNQILWKLNGYTFSGIYILNAYATPLPIQPNIQFYVYASIFTPYNNTTVSINLTKFFGEKYIIQMTNLSSSGNFRYYYSQITTPSSFNYNAEFAIIKAQSGNHISSYNLSLYSSSSASPDVTIEQGGITLENSRPVHGSSDPVQIIVRDNAPIAATFNLFVYDRYPNGTQLPIQNNFGNIKVNNEWVIDGTFSVGAFSVATISFIWENVGGNGPGAGNNVLIAGLTNITGTNGVIQIPNPPNVTQQVFVQPKILLVNEQGIYSGTNSDVSEYYKVMLEYSGYTNDYLTVPYGGAVNLTGYDLIIWFTGSNNQGISSTQLNQLSNFYSNGGKLFIINPTVMNIQSFQSYNVNYNATVNISSSAKFTFAINQIKSLNLIYQPNMNSYVSSDGILFNASVFGGTWNNLTYFHYNGLNLAISGYAKNGNGGRIVYLGFEFARLPLYQQDYVGNKILMWLFNVTFIPGYQLALTDIVPSTYTPLFSQNINISFYISNLSPVNLTTQLEVLMNGNFYNYYSIPQIPKNGGFIIYNISWNATPPGYTYITGILDPFHEIPQINYALDEASSLVNTTIFVQYSVLILKLQSLNGKSTYGTPDLNSSLQSLGVKYNWMLYNPSSSVNYSNVFKRYNTVILDSDSSLLSNSASSLSLSNLNYAIESYYSLGTTTMSGLYSMFFIGNGTYALITKDLSSSGTQILGQLFSISFGQRANLPSGPDGLYLSFGNNITNPNYGFFGSYMTNSIGYLLTQNSNAPIYYIKSSQNLWPILGTEWNGTGNAIAVIGNQNGFRYFIGDFGLSQISGLIQYHSSQYSPLNASMSSRLYFMLMLMGFVNYTVNKIIPNVLASSISYSSSILMINRYYVVNGAILNLGNKGGSAEIEAFDGSGLFGTQTVYLPPLSEVPVQFIWDPQFAAMPQNPRDIRIVVSYVTGSYISSLNFLREAINQTPVYVFYDNLSTGDNWNSYSVVWAYTGVNFYGTQNDLISAEPYNTEGYAATSVSELSPGVYYSSSSNLFSYIDSSAWGFFNNSISGGYSLGTSYDYYSAMNGYGWDWSYTGSYYVVQTENLKIHGSAYVYLQMDANFMLSLGGEGVAVFVSFAGNSKWYEVMPTQGYPSNVNAAGLSNNYIYPSNNADLMPAFTGVSSGEYHGWEHFTFNLSSVLIQNIPSGQLYKDNAISIAFVLVIGPSGYNFNIYGNDYFMADNIKVIENGTSGLGGTPSHMWHRVKYGNNYVFNSSTIVNSEVAYVVSVPITLIDLYNATLYFMTNYSIYAWFADANDPLDTPYGYRLYVGIPGQFGQIIWNQIDTRWAGEAGAFPSLSNAATIPSAYYSGLYAFHETGTSISLSGYIGSTIYIKFEVNGDYYNYSNPPPGFYGSTGMYEPSMNSPYWADFTDVIITGQSYADLIQVNEYWY